MSKFEPTKTPNIFGRGESYVGRVKIANKTHWKKLSADFKKAADLLPIWRKELELSHAKQTHQAGTTGKMTTVGGCIEIFRQRTEINPGWSAKYNFQSCCAREQARAARTVLGSKTNFQSRA